MFNRLSTNARARPVVVALVLFLFDRQGVGLAERIGCASVVTPRVKDVGQGEQQPRSNFGGQLGIGHAFFERGEVGVRYFAAEERRQSSVRKCEIRLQPERLAEGGLGFLEVAFFFEQSSDIELSAGKIRLDPKGSAEVFASLGTPAVFLQRPAQRR